MIAPLAFGLLALAASLTAVPVVLRLAPASRTSAALRAAAIVAAAIIVAGFAFLAHSCIRESCIAAAATIAGDCR